jgi:hypothetical protein
MDQVVELLPSKHKALSLNSSPAKGSNKTNKKKKKRKKEKKKK